MPDEELLTYTEVQERFNVSYITVYRWRKRGLKSYQPNSGGRVFFKLSDVRDWIESHPVDSTDFTAKVR